MIYLISLYICLLACFCFVPTCAQLLKARDRSVQGYGREDHGNWTGSYMFVQGSDPQPGLLDQIKGGNGTKWKEEIRRLNLAVATVNNMTTNPGFLMITGDLVNAFPGDQPYRRKQRRDVVASLKKIQVPTFVISGNHDLLNTPTKHTIRKFRRRYGDDYYSFYYGGVMYIALNSQYFYDSSKVRNLAQEQMDWLDQQLALAKSDTHLKHVVIFMHIPLFISSADEPENYFNIPPSLREVLIGKFTGAGVKILFSGHYHRNAGGVYTPVIDGHNVTFECVVSSAIGAQLGEDKPGLRIVNVDEDRITHKYYALEDVPK